MFVNRRLVIKKPMHKKTKKVIAVVVLTIALAASVSLKVYFLRDHSGGTVFWRGEEAYLFLGAGHTGYRFSYLKYPFVVLGQYFNVVSSPERQFGSSLVIHVTPSAVERHVTDDTEATGSHFLTPFEDGFYAMCPGAIFCKWTSNGFKPATKEEEQSHGGVDGLVRGSMDNQIVNGWHVRYTGSPSAHFEVEIGKNLVISVRNHIGNESVYQSVSIDLLRSGQAPENLYNVDGTTRRVSKSEYERTFKKP
jgi:hypothetical protein